MNHCIDCKKEIKNYKAKRCWECYVKYSQIPENNPNYKGGIILKKHYCLDCNTEIHWCTALYRGGKCHSCAIKGEKNHFFGVHLSGILSPTYIDGRSYEPYTSEFTNILKEQIRDRDNHECQNCDMTEEEHIIVHGQILHIHHIDYDKTNCNNTNLITLCLQCNIRANKNRDIWLKFYTNLIETTERIMIGL